MPVHRYMSLNIAVLFHRSIFWSFACICAFLLTAPNPVHAQQVSTNGFAIIDSPQRGAHLNAESPQEIAIEILGNGNLPSSTGIDSIEIYLVSQTSNITVAGPAQVMSQEPGSTVKHFAWSIPPCVSTGQHELIFYEISHSSNKSFFSITPIDVNIDNGSQGSNCPLDAGVMSNAVQGQPQDSSPPDPALLDAIHPPGASQPGMATITGLPSSTVPLLPFTVNLSSMTTVVLLSTVVSTQSGAPSIPYPSTASMSMLRDDDSRFVPVNAAYHLLPHRMLPWTFALIHVLRRYYIDNGFGIM